MTRKLFGDRFERRWCGDSTAATLTVGNTAPTLTPVADQTTGVDVVLSVTNVATDPDVPPQTLSFSLISGPGSVDSTYGHLHVARAGRELGHVEHCTVAVTDNGSPNLSATNSFAVIVIPLPRPTENAPRSPTGSSP